MLNLNDREMARAGRLLSDFLRDYVAATRTSRITPELDPAVVAEIAGNGMPETGIGVDALFRYIVERVVPNSTAVAHPRFLAYVLGPPNGIAPYAEAIAAALNQNCNFAQLSPVANIIEQAVVRWTCDLFSYPADAGGLFTSGGSMATLTALATAVNRRCPDFRRRGLQSGHAPLVVYTSEQAHRSVEKAAVILGLGSEHVRAVPVDPEFRMRPDKLREAIRADRSAGRRPCCVVVTAGTTNTGAIDPLTEVAGVCHEEGLWLHVDGAYGGLFVLSDRRRAALLPCGEADSIAIDPHKLLFAPLEAGCLLVRDAASLRDAFTFPASYLPSEVETHLLDFMDYGPQLSRDFKAFKVWCALQTFGVSAFRAAVDHTLDMAGYLADRVRAEPALELMAPVALTAVCFRVCGAPDATYPDLLARLAADGTALLGPVRLAGRTGVRVCVTNYRTSRADLDLVVDRLLAWGSTV